MPCRSRPTCSRKHVVVGSFSFFLLPPDAGSDRPVTVCGREVKGSESNTPDGLLFLSFFLCGKMTAAVWRF